MASRGFWRALPELRIDGSERRSAQEPAGRRARASKWCPWPYARRSPVFALVAKLAELVKEGRMLAEALVVVPYRDMQAVQHAVLL